MRVIGFPFGVGAEMRHRCVAIALACSVYFAGSAAQAQTIHLSCKGSSFLSKGSATSEEIDEWREYEVDLNKGTVTDSGNIYAADITRNDIIVNHREPNYILKVKIDRISGRYELTEQRKAGSEQWGAARTTGKCELASDGKPRF